MTVTNNIYQKQIKYHIFNAVTNSELTELVPVFFLCTGKIPPEFGALQLWIKPEALKSLYRSPGYKKNQLVLCKNYVL